MKANTPCWVEREKGLANSYQNEGDATTRQASFLVY